MKITLTQMAALYAGTHEAKESAKAAASVIEALYGDLLPEGQQWMTMQRDGQLVVGWAAVDLDGPTGGDTPPVEVPQ